MRPSIAPSFARPEAGRCRRRCGRSRGICTRFATRTSAARWTTARRCACICDRRRRCVSAISRRSTACSTCTCACSRTPSRPRSDGTRVSSFAWFVPPPEHAARLAVHNNWYFVVMATFVDSGSGLRRVIGDDDGFGDRRLDTLDEDALLDLYRSLVLLRTYDERS